MKAETGSDWLRAVLPEALWKSGSAQGRSNEATPLYVERYAGPRTVDVATRHDFWELTFVLSGHGALLAADRAVPCFPNAAILVPPRLWHRENAQKTMDTIWIGYKGARLRDLDDSDIIHATCPDLGPWCERLWTLASEPIAASGAELDGLSELILCHVLRVRKSCGAVTESVIEESVHFIRDHCGQPLTIGFLARRSGFSEGHFHRSFRQHTGMTPHAFIERERVRQAVRWLRHTAEPVKGIAHRVGYEDPLYFSRAFKKIVGISPREFRKKGLSHDERPVGGSLDLQRPY